MNNIFGRSEPVEHTYFDDGAVEPVSSVQENVEVPEKVEPDVEKPKAPKVDRRGKPAGGSDYVFYGDF